MITATGLLTIGVMLVGFIYWPLLFVRLHDILSPCKLTKKKIAASIAFSIIATAAVIMINPNIYDFSGPYTLVTPLVAIAPVFLLALGKTEARGTKAKVLILAVYLHVFWQVFPKINMLFITTDLIGIAMLFLIAKLHSSIKGKIKLRKPRLPRPKLRFRREKKKGEKSEERKEENKKEEQSSSASISDLWK